MGGENHHLTLTSKEKSQLLGGGGGRTTTREGGGQMTEHERRCEAETTKGSRCKSKATLYQIYEGDHQEYLTCKLHHKYFKPYPGIARERQQVNQQ